MGSSPKPFGKGPISISVKRVRGSKRRRKATNAGNCRDVDHETLKKFHPAQRSGNEIKAYRQKISTKMGEGCRKGRFSFVKNAPGWAR